MPRPFAAAPQLNAPNTLAAGKTGNDFIASLDVAWEIDLFGRLRNTTAAANARAQGSAADLGRAQSVAAGGAGDRLLHAAR